MTPTDWIISQELSPRNTREARKLFAPLAVCFFCGLLSPQYPEFNQLKKPSIAESDNHAARQARVVLHLPSEAGHQVVCLERPERDRITYADVKSSADCRSEGGSVDTDAEEPHAGMRSSNEKAPIRLEPGWISRIG